MKKAYEEVTQKLLAGGIGVLPTDTIYGIVARALDAKAVERVYEVRRRRPDKPCIILIADVSDLEQFGVAPLPVLEKLWPGAVSVILSCHDEASMGEGGDDLVYLHRGTNALAFRLPAGEDLRELLRKTGPLIAPSANIEGMKPAVTIEDAKVYFDDKVDFYVDVGMRVGEPSTLVEVKDGRVLVLRQGAVNIPVELL